MVRLVVFLISFIVRVLRAVIRSRADLVIENVALRQQVATLLKQRRRPTLDNADRAFWVALRAVWPRLTNTLVIVKTDTVASGSISSPLGYDLPAAASRSTSN